MSFFIQATDHLVRREKRLLQAITMTVLESRPDPNNPSTFLYPGLLTKKSLTIEVHP